jgi:IS5 family transposase
MHKQESLADMEYANRKRRTKKDEFLEIMEEVIVWEEWIALVAPYYPNGKRGRPPRGVEAMLRMYLLANWFNLSCTIVNKVDTKIRDARAKIFPEPEAASPLYLW